MNNPDLNALYCDLETELLPLLDYCKFIYINNELKSIALKDNIKTNEVCLLFKCKRTELNNLFNWFNRNLYICNEIKKLHYKSEVSV